MRFRPAFLLCVLVSSALWGQTRPEFLDAPAYSVLPNPAAIAVGDFDRDGKPDIVEAGQGVTTLLGNGDGTFRTGKNSVMTQNPGSLAIADLNEDGKLDLVTTDFKTNVSILLGNGDGSFQPFTNFAAGTKPNSVAVADFNGDGHQDLAVADGKVVNILLGNGDGTFHAPVSWTAGRAVFSVTTGDFNGDHASDLVVSDPVSNAVILLLGVGNGTFQSPISLTTGTFPGYVLVADLNGDSKPDLAVPSSNDYNVEVFLGNGDGTFQPRRDYATREAPFEVVAGDFTGDHKTDLVAMSFDAELLVGNGDGTFQDHGDFGAGVSSSSPVVGRFNRDATDDLAVLNYSYYDHIYSVSILLGNPDGSFRTRRHYPTYVNKPGSGIYMALADFNKDGENDAVTINDGITVLPGNGDGTFQPPLVSPTGQAPFRFVLGDFNGDGKIDVATTNQNDFVSSSVSILLGNGDGTFQPHVDFIFGPFPSGIQVGDLNGDKLSDIVISQGDSQSATLSIFLSKGDGTFQPPTTIALNTYGGISGIADVNGDGKADLLVLGPGLDVFLGRGDGTFQAQHSYLTGSNAASLIVTDLNRDGKVDIVTANLANSISVLFGNGDGTFQSHIDSPTAPNPVAAPNSIASGDFNGDGYLDIAVAEADTVLDGEFVSVLLGKGDGTFQTGVEYEVGYLPFGIGLDDFNHDGTLDIATMSENGSLAVLLNAGATKLTLKSSKDPSHSGDSVTFSANVKATMPGTGNPRGRVRFEDGKIILGTVALTSGTAQFTTSVLAVGNHRIDAVYEGDTHFNPHKSDVLVQQVLP